MPRETLPSLRERAALADRAVLVTGASGAFGSATLRLARQLGASALGLDVKAGDGVLPCDVADDGVAGLDAPGGGVFGRGVHEAARGGPQTRREVSLEVKEINVLLAAAIGPVLQPP